MQVTSVDQSRAAQPRKAERSPDSHFTRSMAVDRALGFLRQAVANCGYTLDALEAHTGKNRAYVHRVLGGESRCTLDFIVALPCDVKLEFTRLVATHFELVVIEPAQGDAAAHSFVAGLLGLLRHREVA
jgi:hypothetical protein